MPSRSPATDRKQQDETADSGYFAPLAQGRYFLVTTPRPKGAPVSVRVQGIIEGDRAYIGIRRRSGTARYLQHSGSGQVTACDALGLVSYGAPRYAAALPLSGEQASWVAGQLARKYPARRRFPVWLPPRTRVHYELAIP